MITIDSGKEKLFGLQCALRDLRPGTLDAVCLYVCPALAVEAEDTINMPFVVEQEYGEMPFFRIHLPKQTDVRGRILSESGVALPVFRGGRERFVMLPWECVYACTVERNSAPEPTAYDYTPEYEDMAKRAPEETVAYWQDPSRVSFVFLRYPVSPYVYAYPREDMILPRIDPPRELVRPVIDPAAEVEPLSPAPREPFKPRVVREGGES